MTTELDLTRNGPLPNNRVAVLRSLRNLGSIVPPVQWCLIGGLMVEMLLASREAVMIRPTDDGDIVGDVVTHRGALRSLTSGLQALHFKEEPTGWGGDISVRYLHPDDDVRIDVLTPANTSKLKGVFPPRPNKRSLEAPGTDFALTTASDYLIRYADDEPPLPIRVPSIAGAIYAKASAWQQIRSASNPTKHLQDAAALLTVANLRELTDVSTAFTKRLRWLNAELTDRRSIGWEHVDASTIADASTRLAVAIMRG